MSSFWGSLQYVGLFDANLGFFQGKKTAIISSVAFVSIAAIGIYFGMVPAIIASSFYFSYHITKKEFDFRITLIFSIMITIMVLMVYDISRLTYGIETPEERLFIYEMFRDNNRGQYNPPHLFF